MSAVKEPYLGGILDDEVRKLVPFVEILPSCIFLE